MTGPPVSDDAEQHGRSVRFPADRRTPAAARAIVRSVLLEAGQPELLNEALLLTTELCTNAVEHAATELDLEVVADPAGLTVEVTDFAPSRIDGLVVGKPNATPDIGEVPERGRGLLLVDHFASRWGTTHLRSGKGVWFRLDLVDAVRDDKAAPPPGTGLEGGTTGTATATPAAPTAALQRLTATGHDRQTGAVAADGRQSAPAAAPSVAAISALMQVTPDPYADDPLPDFAQELLSRVAEMVGAAGGAVWLDRGDGEGLHVLTRYGRTPRTGEELLTVPLVMSRPYRGSLELDASPSSYAQPLAALLADRLSLHLENDRLRRADRRRQSWLTFLLEASELLAQSLDVELTMALVPQLVVPRLGRWCAVHTTDEWGRLRLSSASHADESMLPELHSVLAATGPDSIQARLREATRIGSQVPLGAPMDGVAVPLVARGQRLGTLAVGRHEHHRHDSDEVSVLEDIARRAALAMDNARIHAERRHVAHTLQQSLLPPALPVIEGIGFAAEYVPAGDTVDVGGDFYDVMPLPEGRWLVVIGDVSGKGVQAAAITGVVRDVIRLSVADGKPLPEILARINETLIDRGGGRYCTLAMAAVGRGDKGRLDVSLYLAGHDQPVLVCGDGSGSRFVGTSGTALGLLETIASPALELSLTAGDALVFYTDGVTERRRGAELFGLARLQEAATPLSGYSADVIAARLRSTAINFSVESPRDDIAILVLRNDSA